jgi:hypothetical protein
MANAVTFRSNNLYGNVVVPTTQSIEDAASSSEVVATPVDSHQKFSHWTVDGVVVADPAALVLTNVLAPHDCVAHFVSMNTIPVHPGVFLAPPDTEMQVQIGPIIDELDVAVEGLLLSTETLARVKNPDGAYTSIAACAFEEIGAGVYIVTIPATVLTYCGTWLLQLVKDDHVPYQLAIAVIPAEAYKLVLSAKYQL